MSNGQVAPYYLAVNRGFYCSNKNPLEVPDHVSIVYSSNIRRATAYDSFEEAEIAFKRILDIMDSSRKHQVTFKVSPYYAILAAPSLPLISTFAIRDGEIVEIKMPIHNKWCIKEEAEEKKGGSS